MDIGGALARCPLSAPRRDTNLGALPAPVITRAFILTDALDLDRFFNWVLTVSCPDIVVASHLKLHALLQVQVFFTVRPNSAPTRGGASRATAGVGKAKVQRANRRLDPYGGNRPTRGSTDGNSPSEGTSSPETGRKRPRHATRADADQQEQWACPYYKRNPLKYQECLGYRLGDPHAVAQHLMRSHKRCGAHCVRCGTVFNAQGDYDHHLRSSVRCQIRVFQLEGLSDEQILNLSVRSSGRGNLPKRERWYFIWDVVFPGQVPPTSPHVHPDFAVEVYNVGRRIIQYYAPLGFANSPLETRMNWDHLRSLVPNQENLLHLAEDNRPPPGRVMGVSGAPGFRDGPVPQSHPGDWRYSPQLPPSDARDDDSFSYDNNDWQPMDLPVMLAGADPISRVFSPSVVFVGLQRIGSGPFTNNGDQGTNEPWTFSPQSLPTHTPVDATPRNSSGDSTDSYSRLLFSPELGEPYDGDNAGTDNSSSNGHAPPPPA